jgi:hypothetical protein
MPRKLLIGLIASLCVESVFADSACGENEVLVKDSSEKASEEPLPYQVGTCLSKGTYLTLKEEQWIELQYRKESRTVHGPYSDWIAIEKKGFLETMIERLIKRLGRRVPSSNCGVWEIDALQDNAFCFEPTVVLNLCRAKTSRTDTLVIKDRKTGRKESYNWQHSQNSYPWPVDDFPVDDGAVYRVRLGGKIRKLTFHQVPNSLSGSYETAWMIDNKCFRQAKIRLSGPKVP